MSNASQVIILGTADWNQQIATNQHYIAKELSMSCDVLFVESIGLRRPEFRWRDIRRIIGRLRSAVRPHSNDTVGRSRGSIEVVSPLIFPIHTGFLRIVNSVIMRNLIRKRVAAEAQTLLWTYTPVTYGIERYFDRVVYHCVDLLAEVQGINAELIEASQRHLATVTDVSIATTEPVSETLRAQGFRPLVWPNVADTATISESGRDGKERVPKRVVFAGNLAPQKVDFSLLELLVERGFELHLAGPIAEGGGDSHAAVQNLVSRGAIYHGVLNLEALGALYWTACCGLIPYVINSYTLGVSPLKTYEYFAAGLGVVSTPLPSVRAIDQHLVVADTREAFLVAVEDMSSLPSAEYVSTRRAAAEDNSWSVRGKVARKLVAEVFV